MHAAEITGGAQESAGRSVEITAGARVSAGRSAEITASAREAGGAVAVMFGATGAEPGRRRVVRRARRV